MAALPNTDNLDLPARGLPSIYIINLDSGPNINTMTLDVASRGLPTIYMRDANTSVATSWNIFQDEGLMF